jgi:nitronate monooxygenase
MGTAFVACEESGASEHHRRALLGGKAGRTALTRAFSGRLGRAIKNRLLDELNQPGVELLPYPLQRALMKHLSGPAERAEDPDLSPMWAGQAANLSRHTDATTLLQSLVSEVASIAGAVLEWNGSR